MGLLILSGIAAACGGLTRPTYQILALVIAVFLLMTHWVIGEKAFSYRSCIKAGVGFARRVSCATSAATA